MQLTSGSVLLQMISNLAFKRLFNRALNPVEGSSPHVILTLEGSLLNAVDSRKLFTRERFIIEFMTSDRKLKASREGSK